MRLFKLLVASALSLTVLAAKKPAASKFDKYHAQALSATPFEIDDASYNDLTSSPRDYTAAVLLTALDARFGCQLCKMFQPEWETLAKSWIKKDKKGEHKVLFSTLDFANGKNTFQRLQLQTAPVLLLFFPTTGPNASPSTEPLRYDFSGEVTGEMIHGWVTRHLPALEEGKSYPAFVRPVNYTRFVVSITVLIGFVTFVAVAWPYVLPVMQNRNLWAAISLIAVLLFTSGHMFNHIRKVPYVSGNGRGGVSYFAGGFSNQYGMETQIVAAMCRYLLASTKDDANFYRRCSTVLRYNRTGAQGSEDEGRSHAASVHHHLGHGHCGDVQLPDECVPWEESRLSFLAASFLLRLGTT